MAEVLAAVTAMILTGKAVYTDVKRGKIDNSLIVIGLLGGFVFSAIRDGPEGIWYSAKMVGIVFVSLIFLFVIKGLGAGDIKLLCVLAAFFPDKIIEIIAASFFSGAVIAVGKMLLRFVRNQTIYIRHEVLNFSVPVLIGMGCVLSIGWICS